jgi:hypothetical protein
VTVLAGAIIEPGVLINAGALIGYKAEVAVSVMIDTRAQIDHCPRRTGRILNRTLLSMRTFTMAMIQRMIGNLFQAIPHKLIFISGVGCLWKSNL